MTPSENIRVIWQEIKELKRLYEEPCASNTERLNCLSDKYENIDILFGHEESLLKAIIYYLDTNV